MKKVNGTVFFNVKTGLKLFKSKQNRKSSSLRKRLSLFAMDIFISKVCGSSNLQKVFGNCKQICLLSLVAFCFILSAFFYSRRVWIEMYSWTSTHTVFYISLTYVFLCPL